MDSLRVGAARTNITPPLGSHLAGDLGDRLAEDVQDELYAKALVVQSGTTRVAWAVCDLIAMERTWLDVARSIASSATGIPVHHITVACTHTHYGPAVLPTMFGCPCNEDYLPWVVRKIADSIILADRRRRPARMGHASAQCPEEVFNRRHHMTDGSVRTNPGHLNPDVVRPAGPVDPEIAFIVFETTKGNPLAVLANYALHYVGGPYRLSVSADYFGAFERHMQRLTQTDLVAIMANGCFGDINNVDVSRPAPAYPYPLAKADAVAERVAGRLCHAWRTIDTWQTAPPLTVAADEFPFRRREPSPHDVEHARRVVRREVEADDLDAKYAAETLAVAGQPVVQPTVLQAFVLGDVGLATLPGEMFCKLGLDLKRLSPTPRTLVVGLGNDWRGYIPNAEAFDQGGYELRTARSAKAARGMGEALVDTALRLLRQATDAPAPA